MATPPKSRFLIEDSAKTGSWNMAVDEFLLQRALDPGELSVRIYRWSQPTISLGYFQDSDEFKASGQYAGLPAVRRLSGGGAILHDREITYSLAVPSRHPLAEDPMRLYELAHSGIQTALKPLDVELAARGTPLSLTEEPFLCFSRGDRNDLLLNGVKVVGSAQRRRKGAVLQHGSILLEASTHEPSLHGIADLVPGFCFDTSLAENIGRKILASITHSETARDRFSYELSHDELARIREIESAYYSNLDQLRLRKSASSTQD